jgi:hypothetical protein
VAPRWLVAGALDGIAPGLLLGARAMWESVNNRWNQWVLNYSRGSQFELLKNLGFNSPSWEDLALLLVGLASGASLAGAMWAWWDHRRQDPWLRAWARVRRRAAALGLPAADHVPPRTLAAALRARAGARAEAAVRALEALEALRYAPSTGSARSAARPSPRRLADDAVRALASLAATGALRLAPARAKVAMA